MMGPATKYIFKYSVLPSTDILSLECEPENWQDFEMGLVREGFGVNREITAELTFSGTASTTIQALFLASKLRASLTMEFYQRNNLWTYDLFNTFKADFTTYSFSRGKVSLTFIENSVRRLIDDNKGTEYEFPLPETDNLTYEGISYDKTNRFYIQPPRPTDTSPFYSYHLGKLGSSWNVLEGKKSVRQTSTLYEMPYVRQAAFRFKAACTPTITVKAGVITIFNAAHLSTVGVCIAAIRVAANGAMSILRDNNGSYVKWDGPVSLSPDKHYLTFSIEKEITISTVPFAIGEQIVLCFGSEQYFTDFSVYQSRDTSFQVSSVEPSLNTGLVIPIVSHEWCLAQLLTKIAPTASLTYTLPTLLNTTTFALGLTSADGITNAENPVIKCSFDKIIQSLKCHYGADYDVTGTVVTVSLPSMFFSGDKAQDVEPIGKVTVSTDTTHVYNKITAGYETSEDAMYGTKEFNCKNTFTVPNTLTDKELSLVSPFIGSPYTIEQFMSDKTNSSTESKNEDSSIFVFAVNKVVSNATTLYRNAERVEGNMVISRNPPYTKTFFTNTTPPTVISGVVGVEYYDLYTLSYWLWNGDWVAGTLDLQNYPPKAYNTVISPSQMILANERYIAISLGTDKIMTFASTDRKADYYQTIAGVKHYENSISPSLISTPLFQAETIEFSTAQEIKTIATINAGLYKYFSILDNNTGLVHNFYIKNITLQLTRINSQEWKGLSK